MLALEAVVSFLVTGTAHLRRSSETANKRRASEEKENHCQLLFVMDAFPYGNTQTE